MNLLDFTVTEIIEETRGPVYELSGMTREQAEAAEPGPWKDELFSEGVKQTYREHCYGIESIKTKIFAGNEKPYFVGYGGLC